MIKHQHEAKGINMNIHKQNRAVMRAEDDKNEAC
jgi:hypothetical protein